MKVCSQINNYDGAIVHGIGHGSLELEEVLPLTEPLTDRDKLNVGEN